MPNKHDTLASLFGDIADEIRTKLPVDDPEKSSDLIADDFDTAISRIQTPADGSLPGKAAATYYTSTTDQVIEAGQFLEGAQTIKAVTTSGISVENVRDGAQILVGDVGDNDRIIGVVGTFSDSSTITGSGKSAASASNILTGKSAFLDGAQLNGTMPNNGATGTTITSQGETYTIPAGYTTGGTVTANITPSTLDNTIISGEAVVEATDDYAWKTTVNIPTGYHNAQTIVKEFSDIFPAPTTEGTAPQVLAGYELFDHTGKKITGTMPNNSATGGTIVTQGGTYLIPAGYTSGGTVTANINNAVITSGAGSATVSDPSYNSSTGKFDQTVSGTVSAPTVGTAGYISSTAGTKNGNSVSGSKSLNKVGTGVDITGTTTTKPSISRTTKPSGDSWTDAASGDSTTTKPTSTKPYVRVDSAANTGTLTATPKVTSEGYGTSSYHGATASTATVGASASDPTYIPITEGSAGTPSASKGTVSNNQVTVTPSVTNTTGWITGSTKTGTGVTVKASELVSGNKALSSGTSAQTGIDVTNYATVSISAIPAGTAGTPIATKGAVSSNQITVTPSVTNTTGYITGGTVTGEGVVVAVSELVSGNKSLSSSESDQTGIDVTNYATVSISGMGRGTLSAADSSLSGGSFTPTLTYNSTSGKFDYSGSASATGTAWAKASTAGYVSSANNTSKSLSASVSATGSVNKVGTGVDITGSSTLKPRISRGTPASGDTWTDAASGTAITDKPTSGPYVKVSSEANTGTLTATPKVTSAGYGTTESGQYSSTPGTATVGASASDATYVKVASGTAGTPTASKGTVSSNQVTVTPSVTNSTGWITGDTKTGTGVVVKASELVSGNKALASGTSAQTGIDVTNYATVSISAIAAGTHSGTVSTHTVSNPTVTPSIGGTSTSISSTTKPSGTDGTDYWTLDPGGSVTTNGSSTAKAKATIGTAGYISTDSSESAASTITLNSDKITIAAGTNRYISKATNSKTAPTSSATAGTASIVNQPSASASTSVTGMVTTSTNTGYSVSATASANSGNSTATGGSASTTAGSVTVSAGYNPSAVTVSVAASSKSGNTATSTAVSDNASDTKFIQKGVLGASVSSNSGGSASMAATGFTAAGSATSYYVTLSTSSGSVKAKASVATEGYVKSETAETGATAVTVSGNNTKLYIPAGNPAFDGGDITGSTDISGSNVTLSTTDNGISVSASGSANRANVLYNGAVAGYVSKADNAVALSGATGVAITGKTKYISAVTIPSSKSLSITNNGTATITNSGTSNVTNSGTTTVTSGISGTTTSGTLKVTAYPSSGTTADAQQTIVSSGRWSTPTATNIGNTYYGKVTVPTSLTNSKKTVIITSTGNSTTSAITNVTNNAYSTTNVTSGSSTSGTVTVNAYNNAATPALTGALTIVSGGKLVYGGATPSATKGTASGGSITVTPKVTRTAGYITAGTADGTAVTVSASELVSGTHTFTPSDSEQSADVTNIATAKCSAITYSNAPTVTLGYGTLSASTSKGRYNAGTNNVTIGLGTGNNTLTAKASHILSGYRAIGTNSDGTAVASVSGSMTNNGAGSTTTLDSTTTSKTIAAGYWSSSNTVSISVATLTEVKQKLGLS